MYLQYKKTKEESLVVEQEQKIKHHLQKQLALFHDAWLQFDAWQSLIDDNDEDGLYSPKDIFNLRRQCKYLFFAVCSILRHYAKKTITECFQQSIELVHEYESCKYIEDESKPLHPATLMIWFRKFNSNCTFQNRHKHNGSVILPMLFSSNPDLQEGFVLYCYKHLSTLSAELLHNYLFSTTLPSLLERRRTETNNNDMTMQDLLHENNLQTLQ